MADALGGVAQAIPVCMGQQDDELFSTPPPDEIVGPQAAFDPLDDLLEHVVAAGVAEGVVDVLEK